MTRQVSGPVRFERGRGVHLAYCASCLSWRELANTRPEALRAAAVHVDQVHDDPRLARHLRELAARQARRDTPTHPD